MRVKKFEAKTMKEALQMIKNDLGPEAVILSAKDHRNRFGIAGEGSVEVTAAVSEQTLRKKQYVESRLLDDDRVKLRRAPASEQRRVIDKMVDSKRASTASAMAAATAAMSEPAPRRPITSTSYIDIPDDEDQIERRPSMNQVGRALRGTAGHSVHDLLKKFDSDDSEDGEFTHESSRAAAAERAPLDSASNPAMARIRAAAQDAWAAGKTIAVDPQKSARPKPVEVEIGSLKSEIQRLQSLLDGFQKIPQSLVSLHPGASYGLPYELSSMFSRLTEAGISPEFTTEILAQAQREMDAVQLKKKSLIDAWVAKFLLQKVQVVNEPWAGKVHLFVGGNGTGKTSTLVKIASHLVIKEKKRVAILTTDTRKVGAADQLKIYCQILNVPFAIVRNSTEWDWMFQQLKGVDHILVDFPGFQLRDLEEIHEFKALLPPASYGARAHLLVNVCAKDVDSLEIARRYKVADAKDVIFTNLDQSTQHGLIYSFQRNFGLPLHSFGIGGRVPEDFELATKERVLDLIFKLSKFRQG